MTTKTIHYNTESLMKTGKVTERNLGFRDLHTDFTNNNQRDGYDVFYDDQASITPTPTANELRFQVLQNKVLDDTITQRQLVEYERLKIQRGM